MRMSTESAIIENRPLVMFAMWNTLRNFAVYLFFLFEKETAKHINKILTYVEMHILRAVEGKGLKIWRQSDFVVIRANKQWQTAKRLFLLARHRLARSVIVCSRGLRFYFAVPDGTH